MRMLLGAYLVALVVACAMAKSADPQAMKAPRYLQAIVYRQFRPAGSWAIRRANCIVQRESQWNPRAISRTDDWGLWQLHRPIWSRVYDWSRILNPSYNTWAAWQISRH